MESDKITDLRNKLKEAEEERLKAAQYGLQLLESQTELQSELDKCRHELMAVTEKYEQETYTLQRAVELKSRMLESLSCEYEAAKQQQKAQLEQQEEQLGRRRAQEVGELRDKLGRLKADLDEARLSEKQLRHKAEHQRELLAQKAEELRLLSARGPERASSELLALQTELADAERLKASLEEEVHELRYAQERLEHLSTDLTRQAARLQAEKEEQEREAVSYYNALEKARVQNQDLQVQLSQALQQALDPNSKGNSLFAEVEDRRAAMERQLNSMKGKYQMLKKQNAFFREQMQRMKLQIATLVQMKGSQTASEQQERLFAMVEQKNGEIKHLLGEVKSLEKFKNLYESVKQKPAAEPSSSAPGDSSYYTDLLQLKIQELTKENESARGELSIQRMKALFESQRTLDFERKLFANERCLQVLESENMKLRAKLDELKLKYEPEEAMEVPVLKKRREVLPVDVSAPEGQPAHSASGKEVSRLSPSKEETQSCPDNFKDNSQLEKPVSTDEPVTSVAAGKNLPPDAQPKKEKKCVKLVDAPADAEAFDERDGPSPGPARLAVGSRLQAKAEEEDEAPGKLGKAPSRKAHPVLYVPSKPAAQAQCAQQ
ncbi:protein Spindly [Perognathus longimembris pacificus]|uniref:protein Spindly n=1 Tax=Perognathus longimembris pacificus TaxID=214514 RepID=UPI0020190FB7|nr:protein Spindly [Perognathus longimembris pacificus]